jgi:hypothetical protein
MLSVWEQRGLDLGEEVVGSWNLHNDELHNLYSSHDIIRLINSAQEGEMGDASEGWEIHT